MVDDKWIGLALAVTSTLAIGTSFVITKKGLMQASEQHGFEGDGFSYLKTPLWWGGIITMVIGEIANFAAYAFAPAILVTPLGALSVLIGAVLGSYFLKERLGTLGKLGCAMCLLGAVVIVLHAPPDKEVQTIDEILNYAIQPGFLMYCVFVAVFSGVMIYRIAPRYGRTNPLIYLSICSTVGSVSIMAVKGVGIAAKLTIGGNNQFTHPSTYVFILVTSVCILTQMNYFNKALSQFNTNIVNPLYYVTFTTFTLIASFILFKGFNTTDAVNTISLLCGFLIIFTGVYLLNLSREDPDGHLNMMGNGNGSRYSMVDGIPTDGMAAEFTRRSMQARRSTDLHRRSASLNLSLYSPSSERSRASADRDRDALLHQARPYDLESGNAAVAKSPKIDHFGLGDLTEEPESDEDHSGKRTSFDDFGASGGPVGGGKRSTFERVRPVGVVGAVGGHR